MSVTDILAWRKRDHLGEDLAASLDLSEAAIPQSLLDRAASATDAVLKQANDEIARMDAVIADAQEVRRQAIVIRDAYEPALKQIADGIDPPEPRKGKKPVLQAAE